MDALCAAIPVARALLRVADTASPTQVTLRAGHRLITLLVDRGQAYDVHGIDSEPLGDTLLRMGALDQARHREALQAGYPEQQVGEWLVAQGIASEQAVRAALARQLNIRVTALLRTRGAELLLTPVHVDERGFHASTDLACAVYQGLETIARDLPRELLRGRVGEGALRSTRLGSWLEGRLARGLPQLDLAPMLDDACAEAHWPARAALRAIGALVDSHGEVAGYSLLLRKRRELRGKPSARSLLDLPESASPEQGRAAFRRLARKLHPDRFHAAEPALLALSNEVMRALSSAEAELSRQARRGASAATG